MNPPEDPRHGKPPPRPPVPGRSTPERTPPPPYPNRRLSAENTQPRRTRITIPAPGQTPTPETTQSHPITRRRFLQIGGLTLLVATLGMEAMLGIGKNHETAGDGATIGWNDPQLSRAGAGMNNRLESILTARIVYKS